MMIPAFTKDGVLPPGVHWTEWENILERFGYNEHRKDLLDGMLAGLGSLKTVGCTTVFIDGSFVSDKTAPNDFDICYDDLGIDWDMLKITDPILLDFSYERAIQKAKYKGEFFPMSNVAAPPSTIYFDFFQINKQTGEAKGILGLNL